MLSSTKATKAIRHDPYSTNNGLGVNTCVLSPKCTLICLTTLTIILTHTGTVSLTFCTVFTNKNSTSKDIFYSRSNDSQHQVTEIIAFTEFVGAYFSKFIRLAEAQDAIERFEFSI